MLFFVVVSAQKASNSFTVKFGDRSQFTMILSSASVSSDSSITIIGTTKGNPAHSFQISLMQIDESSKKSFTKGYYHFSRQQQHHDYVPGQIVYELNVFYLFENAGSSPQEWATAYSPTKGFIEIESISDSRIKGRFSCELEQQSPTRGATKMVEGNFNVAIRTKK